MQFSRRFVLVQVAPPLVVAVPAALFFLHHVLPGEAIFRQILLPAFLAYGAGALLLATVIRAAVRRVEISLASSSDASDSVSYCLNRTQLGAGVTWVGWGLVVGMTGSAMLLPTFLGLQYFAEASLIVAAPSMAWSYWTGKGMLTRHAGESLARGYTGRAWSIGAKIAMVFIGFFAVSVGAIVLVISSRVAEKIGEAEAYSIGAFSLSLALGTAAVFGIATYFLARDVTAPIRALVSLSHEMAEGRFDRDPRVFSDDQVGLLARSFGTTRETLRTLIGRVRSSGGVITSGVVTMTTGTKSLLDGAHEQTSLAQESTEALRRVTEEAHSVLEDVERMAGLTADSANRTTELRASSQEMGRQAEALFGSAEKSASAANEIDAAAREMIARSSDLSAIGNEVLAFVSQMDATVSQITKTAESTAGLAVEVRQNAADGEAAVDATVAGIRRTQDSTRRISTAFDALQQSLRQIDGILEFINEITKRTHLLSLNAAIIAAHAGDADSGFSVIANEVRELADRTGSSTKEISGIIRNLQPVTREAQKALAEGVATVDETVGLAAKASGALSTIRTSSDRALDMTHAISASLQEQARASHHLHRVVSGLSDNVAEMQRATEGQAVATRMLVEESEQVHEIARHLRRTTDEQTEVEEGIAVQLEAIALDARMIRDRLDSQTAHTRQIAMNSNDTLVIAHRNNGVAEQFGHALRDLLRQGEEFAADVARFRA
jgi:methyl-accepting chemotaxis protein